MTYVPRRGDIVLIGFPFTDLMAVKVRPAAVVSPTPYHRATADVVLAAITSVLPPRRPLPTEVVVRDDEEGFPSTGLKRASVILCGKLFAAERRLLLRRLGRLDAGHIARLDVGLAAAVGVGPWR
jgi:mRNA interferase MazF